MHVWHSHHASQPRWACCDIAFLMMQLTCARPHSDRHAQPDWIGGGSASWQMMHALSCGSMEAIGTKIETESTNGSGDMDAVGGSVGRRGSAFVRCSHARPARMGQVQVASVAIVRAGSDTHYFVYVARRPGPAPGRGLPSSFRLQVSGPLNRNGRFITRLVWAMGAGSRCSSCPGLC